MNPYKTLPPRNFWRPSIADRNPLDIEGLWEPKFKINANDRVSCYGSCFAQHIGKALRARGGNWYVTEDAPSFVDEKTRNAYSYGVFSSRTGNIYTVSLLKQWLLWAKQDEKQPDEVWEQGGRYIDPFRPRVEPEGFLTTEELFRSRNVTINAFKKSIVNAQYFVFTLGLTESWSNKNSGYEYPMCPGTVAGKFDAEEHTFDNQRFPKIRRDLYDAFDLIRGFNPNIKIILTVSPVPLTATYTPQHVLVATMKSKSTLRCVAGMAAEDKSFVDYFPSYEIINSPAFRGMFFEPNQRSVNPYGVAHVMEQFFKPLDIHKKSVNKVLLPKEVSRSRCEEELLETFSDEE